MKKTNKVAFVFLIVGIIFLVACEAEKSPVIGKDYPSLGIFGSTDKNEYNPGETIFVNVSMADYYNHVFVLKDNILIAKKKISEKSPYKYEGIMTIDVDSNWNGNYVLQGYVYLPNRKEWRTVELGKFFVKGREEKTRGVKRLISGFDSIFYCEEKLCDISFKLSGREVKMASAQHNNEISWYTGEVSEDDLKFDNVTFVWRGAQYGNGRIDWYVNDKLVINSNAVSYSRIYSSEKAELEYINEERDYGTFMLTVSSSILKKGKNKITASMLGEEFIAVQKGEIETLIFDDKKEAKDVYAYSKTLFCPGKCPVAYNTGWGYASGVMIPENSHATFNFNSPARDSYYTRYFFRGTHYGGDGYDIYLGNRRIISMPVFTDTSAIVENGFRVEYYKHSYADGYSGTYYLTIPSSILPENPEISIHARNNSWFFIETIPEEQFMQQGDGEKIIVRGINSVDICENCNLSYPAIDTFVPQYWSTKRKLLSWKMPFSLDRDFTTFVWSGAYYGDISVVWYVNGRQALFTKFNKKADDEIIFASGISSLKFQKITYYAGNQGVFYLTVPKSFVHTDKDNVITAEIRGNGWLMIRE